MGLIKLIKYLLDPPDTKLLAGSTTELGTSKENRKIYSTKKVIVHRNHANTSKSVTRQFYQLWKERKWNRKNNNYSGFYRTRYGSYQGNINELAPGFIKFYIFSPPSCLSRHSHYACFFPRGGNKYEVHFSKKAKNVDEGIMAIEKILAEAHRL